MLLSDVQSLVVNTAALLPAERTAAGTVVADAARIIADRIDTALTAVTRSEQLKRTQSTRSLNDISKVVDVIEQIACSSDLETPSKRRKGSSRSDAEEIYDQIRY
jgi:hypothetical protein